MPFQLRVNGERVWVIAFGQLQQPARALQNWARSAHVATLSDAAYNEVMRVTNLVLAPQPNGARQWHSYYTRDFISVFAHITCRGAHCIDFSPSGQTGQITFTSGQGLAEYYVFGMHDLPRYTRADREEAEFWETQQSVY
jgi:hypothetical protein